MENCNHCVEERKFNFKRGFAVASGIYFIVAVIFLNYLLAILK